MEKNTDEIIEKIDSAISEGGRSGYGSATILWIYPTEVWARNEHYFLEVAKFETPLSKLEIERIKRYYEEARRMRVRIK